MTTQKEINKRKKVRSIFISDIHFGKKSCRADLLYDFIINYEAEYIYLLGDIIDVWKLEKRVFWPQIYNNTIKKIISKTKRGTEIKYVPGNHDEVFRDWANTNWGNIKICDNIIFHRCANGEKFVLLHGDIFDVSLPRILYFIGDKAYDLAILINRCFNFIRRILGMKYWSISKVLKQNVKKAVAFMQNYEKQMLTLAKKNNCSGIICGHIHLPEIKQINEMKYLNCGDWIESQTAIIEHLNGTFELYRAK